MWTLNDAERCSILQCVHRQYHQSCVLNNMYLQVHVTYKKCPPASVPLPKLTNASDFQGVVVNLEPASLNEN